PADAPRQSRARLSVSVVPFLVSLASLCALGAFDLFAFEQLCAFHLRPPQLPAVAAGEHHGVPLARAPPHHVLNACAHFQLTLSAAVIASRFVRNTCGVTLCLFLLFFPSTYAIVNRLCRISPLCAVLVLVRPEGCAGRA